MKRFNQVLLIITISILAASGLAKTASAVAATEHGSLVVAKANAKDGETNDGTHASRGHGTNYQGVHHSESPNGDGDGETNDDG